MGGEDRLDAIASVVRAEKPDAVALVEAFSRENAERLADELEMGLVFGDAWSGFHLAWLTRLPVRRSANHALPQLAKTLVEIEVETACGSVRLFGAHLASSHEVATHPQEAEVVAILDALRTAGGQPHALVGDFNALAADDAIGELPPGVIPKGEAIPGTPRPIITRIVAGGYVDCYRALHGDQPGYTYPADTPWLRLDYVFASPELARRLVRCDVVRTDAAAIASDHLPVLAEFR